MDTSAADYEELQDAQFDTFVEDTLQEFKSPGIVVLIVKGDRTFAKAYGVCDVHEETPLTPQSLFHTASTTKAFTASMAAHLVESEDFPSIHWNTPLAELIRDDFVLDQSTPDGQWATNHVTIEDALSHRTGMSRHDLIWINGEVTNREIVRSMRHVPVHRPLREKWEYGNLGYTSVAVAVEAILQQPFASLLNEHIFQPLGMSMTSYSQEEAKKIADSHDSVHLARGHLWNAETQSYNVVPWSDIAPAKGSGGIISNVLDYSLWARHLMEPSGHKSIALSDRAVRALRTPRMLINANPKQPFVGPQAYCLGLYSQVYRGREIVSHKGGNGGFMSTLLMVPPTKTSAYEAGREDPGWAVVTLQNCYSYAQDVIVWRLLDDFLDTPTYERYNMAQVARDAKAEKEKALRPEVVLARLFPEVQTGSTLPPALPLQAYEGVYCHPAYHEFEVSQISGGTGVGDADSGGENGSTADKPIQKLLLAPPKSQKTYLALSAGLTHVSGEWWCALRQMGIRSWITDEALRVEFVIGVGANVKGLRYQHDASIPEQMIFFEKVK